MAYAMTAPPTQGSHSQSGQVPASNLGHSHSHGLRHDSPLWEGAKAIAIPGGMNKYVYNALKICGKYSREPEKLCSMNMEQSTCDRLCC